MIENLPSKSSDDFLNTNKIAIFQGKKIRKTILNNEWWFSVIDVIEILTGSSIPKRYWSDLKKKLKAEGYVEAYEKIVRLKMLAPDGKMRDTDCANTKIHKERDTKGFVNLREDAKDGGAVAGRTKKDIEKQTGKNVVTAGNYLRKPNKKLRENN